MKKHSFFADTELQADEIKKNEGKVHYLKNQLFLKVETIINFQVK